MTIYINNVDKTTYISNLTFRAAINTMPTITFVLSKASGLDYEDLENALVTIPYTIGSDTFADFFYITALDEKPTFFTCNGKASWIDEQQVNLKRLTFEDGNLAADTTNAPPTGNKVTLTATTIATLRDTVDPKELSMMGVIDFADDVETYEDDEATEDAALGANSMMRTENAPTVTPASDSWLLTHAATRLADNTCHAHGWVASNTDTNGYRHVVYKLEQATAGLEGVVWAKLHLVGKASFQHGGSVYLYAGPSLTAVNASTTPLHSWSLGPSFGNIEPVTYTTNLDISLIDTTNDCIYIRFSMYAILGGITTLAIYGLRVSFGIPSSIHEHKEGRVYFATDNTFYIHESPLLDVYYTTTQSIQLLYGIRYILTACGATGDDWNEGVPFDVHGLSKMQILKKMGGLFMYKRGLLFWYKEFPDVRGWFDGVAGTIFTTPTIEELEWTEVSTAGATSIVHESETLPDSGGVGVSIGHDVVGGEEGSCEYSYDLPDAHTFYIAFQSYSAEIDVGNSSCTHVIALYDGASKVFDLEFVYSGGAISTIKTRVAGNAQVAVSGTIANARIDDVMTYWKVVIDTDGVVTPYIRVGDSADDSEFGWTEIVGASGTNNVDAVSFDSVHASSEVDGADSRIYIMLMQWAGEITGDATALTIIGEPERSVSFNKIKSVTVKGAEGYEATETDTGMKEVLIDLGDVYVQYYCEEVALRYKTDQSKTFISWKVRSAQRVELGDKVSFTDPDGESFTGYVTSITCKMGDEWELDGDPYIEYEYIVGFYIPRGADALRNRLDSFEVR